MIGREMTLIDAEGVAACEDAEPAIRMDEDTFRLVYDRTARPLWAYLSRVTGDPHAADDLLQETYFRFLRASPSLESEAHQRHYLFRIATNLAHDRRRRPAPPEEPLDEGHEAAATEGPARLERRRELRSALGRLKQRERELLWMAYAEGSTHEEIALALGLKASGIRVLLFRARRRLAGLLRGLTPAAERGADRDDR